MNDFSIGTGGSWLEARALPEGTALRIGALSVEKSSFKSKNQRTGQEEDKYQLKVVYETLTAGTTLAYTKTRKDGTENTVAAVAYAAGTKFTQFYSGVYLKATGYEFGPKGSAANEFARPIAKAGFDPQGKLANYVGLVVTIAHEKGRTPTPWVHAVVSGIATATATTPTAPVLAASTTQPAPAVPAGPLASLTPSDQATLLSALKDGDVTPDEVIGAGMATTQGDASVLIAAGRAALAVNSNRLLQKKA